MGTIGNILKQNCQWPVGRRGLPYVTFYLSSSGDKFGSSYVVQQLHIHYTAGQNERSVVTAQQNEETKLTPPILHMQNVLS